MATNVGDLEATLRLRDELSAKLKDVDSQLNKSGQSFETVSTKAKGFDVTGGSLVGTLGKLGAAFGIAFSAKAVVDSIINIGKLGSEITDMATRTGIGVVELQKLGAVAEANGSSMEELGAGIQGMARKLAGGDDAAVTAVRMLGLEVEDLTAMKPDQAFLAVADAAAKIHNPMERTAILTDLGGKAFEKLSPTIANVRSELEDVTTFMDEETVRALAEFDSKTTEFGQAWDVFLAKFALPVVQAATGGLSWLIEQFGKMGKAGKDLGGIPIEMRTGAEGEILDDLIAIDKAARDAAGAYDVFGEAAAALDPKIDENIESFDRATEELRILREDGLYPLTDADKALVLELDVLGASLSKIADVTKLPDAAIKAYLKTVEDGEKWHKAFGKSSDELAQTLYELDVAFKNLQKADTLAQLMQRNTAVLNEFSTRVTEFELLPADQIGNVTAADQAFTKLQGTLNAVALEQTTMGSSAETAALKSAAAWREYNAEVLNLQGGMAAAVTATDGMTAATGRLASAMQSAIQLPVPRDWDWSETYKNSPYYKPYDISGGWSSRNQMNQIGEKARAAAAASGPWGGGGTTAITGAGWGAPINSVVNVNAQNSLMLPSNQQELGNLVSQAVVAQLKAMGVKVGSA